MRIVAEDVSPVGHAKIAAAIVIKRKIISIGMCSYKTHPLQRKWGRNDHSIYLHAEIDAIGKALTKLRDASQLSKASMYVMRVKRGAAFSQEYITGLAKPCEGCMKAINSHGIKHIYWSEG